MIFSLCGVQVHLVDDLSSFELADMEIDREASLYVDCEGVYLSRHGTLRTVSVFDGKNAWIFDMAVEESLRDQFISLIKPLLQSSSSLKIMHGCEMDSDSLGYHAGIHLKNVVDTQLVHGSRISLSRLQILHQIKYEDEGSFEGVNFNNTPTIFRDENPLSENLVKYSAFDVIVLRDIWDKQQARTSKTVEYYVAMSKKNLTSARDFPLGVFQIGDRSKIGRAIGRAIGRGGSGIELAMNKTNSIMQFEDNNRLLIWARNPDEAARESGFQSKLSLKKLKTVSCNK